MGRLPAGPHALPGDDAGTEACTRDRPQTDARERVTADDVQVDRRCRPPTRSSSSAPGRPGSRPPTSWRRPDAGPPSSRPTTWSGGISRTVERDGWRFDIGGHRFFTKVRPVEDLWHEVLPDEDFMLRPRKSRIYYRGKFYDYPLKAIQRPGQPGRDRGVRCVLSYAWARVRPPKRQDMYEGWLAARFGWRLYHHFFKTYTEKVWGHPPSEMPADWAAQRVKNLSLLVRHRQRRPAQAQPEGHHLADRGVPVPQARARDDVGALPRRWSRRPAPRWSWTPR